MTTSVRRVTFVQQGRRDAVCIELLLAGKSLRVTRRGATSDAAMMQHSGWSNGSCITSVQRGGPEPP